GQARVSVMPASNVGSLREEEAPFPAGGPVLHRRSVLPARAARATLALLPGYGDHAGRYVPFLRELAARGVAGHAMDFRGHGRAGGRRGYVSRWDEFLDDLAAFLALPVVRGAGGPLFLLGHSHGGLVAAVAGIRGRVDVAGCIL